MTDCATLDTLWPRATKDFLTGTVTLNVEITDATPVAISFDGENFLDAEWIAGDPGNTRQWQAYVTPDDLPDGKFIVEVTVRVQDSTDAERPIDALLPAGELTLV